MADFKSVLGLSLLVVGPPSYDQMTFIVFLSFASQEYRRVGFWENEAYGSKTVFLAAVGIREGIYGITLNFLDWLNLTTMYLTIVG